MPSVMVYDGEGLSELSTANISAWYEHICVELASNTYTGTITFGNSNPIGSFTDTARLNDVGSADLTIVSNTYFLSQLNTTTLDLTPNAPFAVELDLNDPNTVILYESNVSITAIADEILQHRIAYRTGGYHLGNTAPLDGGTWISLGMMEDTLYNFTINNTSYFLWKKIAGNTTSSFKPLKLIDSTLQEFTDIDVQGIIKKIEQRIIDTGVGTYALQESAPTIGTWTSRGTITDLIRITEPGSVDVEYTASSTTYTGDEYTGSTVTFPVYSGDPIVDGPAYDSDIIYTGVADQVFLSGEVVFNIFQVQYTRAGYTGPSKFFGAARYTSNWFADAIWIGPAVPAANRFTGNFRYTGTVTAFYSGTSLYTSDIESLYTGELSFDAFYTGAAIEYVSGAAEYSGDPIIAGPSYTSDLLYTSGGPTEFQSPEINFGFDVVYTGASYTGVNTSFAGYVNSIFDAGYWVGPTSDPSRRFTGTLFYTGDTTAVYSGTTAYTSDLESSYVEGDPGGGAVYTGTAIVDVISSTTETISSLTLYERIG